MVLELLLVNIEIYKVILITHSIVSGDLYIPAVCVSLSLIAFTLGTYTGKPVVPEQ